MRCDTYDVLQVGVRACGSLQEQYVDGLFCYCVVG